MRIGELAARTGASVRSLRHYESSALLTSRRLTNGYRDFDEDQVERVATIRQLLAAGLDLGAISVVAPCYRDGVLQPTCARARRRAHAELDILDRKANEIDAARTALRGLLHLA